MRITPSYAQVAEMTLHRCRIDPDLLANPEERKTRLVQPDHLVNLCLSGRSEPERHASTFQALRDRGTMYFELGGELIDGGS